MGVTLRGSRRSEEARRGSQVRRDRENRGDHPSVLEDKEEREERKISYPSTVVTWRRDFASNGKKPSALYAARPIAGMSAGER